MKTRKPIIYIVVAIALAMSLAFAACTPTGGDSSKTSSDAGGTQSGAPVDSGGEVDPAKTVSKIEIERQPDKTFYEVGETFTVEGGLIKVTYTDGSTQVLPMSSPSFSVSEPSMVAVGTKNINVRCGTNKATFTVRVASRSFNITYNFNYEGAPEPEVVRVVRGDKAEDKRPVRDGYTFVAWYANKDFIYTYNFNASVEDDAVVYAFWKRNGAEYVDVTFDRNYYGDLYETYTYPVESGTAVAKPTDPVRVGYTFDKWVKADGTPFDFSSTVAEDITIKASWTKIDNDRHVYVFEAEDTSLKGKSGPAFSGEASEEAMIVNAPANRGCSNGRFVSFLYRIENSLDFYLASDEELTDVTIYLRLSAELRDYTFDPSNYAVELNDVPLNYAPITFVGVPFSFDHDPASALDCLPFEDYTIAVNATLKKGANVIRLTTKNSDPMDGTTIVAAAPIVDCLKIETTGVVIWDANRGLPAKNY
ncbi:MAG: InlB B-repeat-containing protein [Clostridia bacterium]|nr:InlB B-repeat-containing protein [Clostridia bacterium]